MPFSQIAIVLTACGIETMLTKSSTKLNGISIAIVLTACGIETKKRLPFN